jgi:hypothetical protein
VIDPGATILLIQQTPKPEAQFPDATAIVSPLFEHSSAVTQIPDIAGVEIVVHSSLGNVTTENNPRTLPLGTAAADADATKKRQSVHFILEPEGRGKGMTKA